MEKILMMKHLDVVHDKYKLAKSCEKMNGRWNVSHETET